MKEQRGAGLLDVLLALAIFMGLLTFAYNTIERQKSRAENAEFVKKMDIVRDSLEQYIEKNKQELLRPINANITRVKVSELKNVPNIQDTDIQLRVIKSRDSGGKAFLQGIVILNNPNVSALRTRQIAIAGGANTGFADGNMLFGSFGTWNATMASVDADVGSNYILAQTKPFGTGSEYLERLPSENDSIMKSDLNLGGHKIKDIKNMNGTNARFLDTLIADSVEASRTTIKNRLDWTGGIDVFGSATVKGTLAFDGQSVDASQTSVTTKARFRDITANEFACDKLSLSGLSANSDDDNPTILSIKGMLNMNGGQITAIDTFVNFSGSITPKLHVTGRIQDAGNSDFYWDLYNDSAVLSDLTLTNLSRYIDDVYSSERTGQTETETIMANIIQNKNATVSDYLRALEQVKKVVSAKYDKIEN